MKTAIIRFTTKMGMTARPDAKIKCDNTISAITLAKTILSTNHHDAYTYSIEHGGFIRHYSAEYHKFIGINKT